MFWFFYTVSALTASYLVFMSSKKSNLLPSYLCLVILLTPAQIEIGLEGYAPALFSLVFNIILEQDYSLRVLRPLALTVPSALFIFLLVFSFKRKFF